MSNLLINLNNNIIINFDKNDYYCLNSKLYNPSFIDYKVDIFKDIFSCSDIETLHDFLYFSNINESYEANVNLLDSINVLKEKYGLKEFTKNDYQYMFEKLLKLLEQNKEIFDYINNYNNNKLMISNYSDILHICRKTVLLIEVPKQKELYIDNYLIKDINLSMFSNNCKSIIIKKKEYIRYGPNNDCLAYNKALNMNYDLNVIDEKKSLIFSLL